MYKRGKRNVLTRPSTWLLYLCSLPPSSTLRARRYRKIKFAMLSYGRSREAGHDAKVKRKFTVTLPTEASRYFKGDSGATLSASRIRIIMSACLLHSVIRDFISSDKKAKGTQTGDISSPGVVARRRPWRRRRRRLRKEKFTAGIHDGRSSSFSSRRFRSS